MFITVFTKAHDVTGPDLEADLLNPPFPSRFVLARCLHGLTAVTLQSILLALAALRRQKFTERQFIYCGFQQQV
jgi:hypothetical protein